MIFAALILGIVQGLTEFLPVSSSGHLVVFQSFLPVAGDHVAFDLALHMGTLLPVLVVYRSDIWRILTDATSGDAPFAQRVGVRQALWVVVGSVPTAAIGLAFEDTFEALFSNLTAVSVAFLVTGTVLWLTSRAKPGSTGVLEMTWWQALLIGAAQGIAITPGISRSGSTIAAGLFLGLDREYAAKYSFLLSIPAIVGAFIFKLDDFSLSGIDPGAAIAGFCAAAVSGYLALVVLLRLVRRGDFSRFAFYLWPLGIAGLAWSLFG